MPRESSAQVADLEHHVALATILDQLEAKRESAKVPPKASAVWTFATQLDAEHKQDRKQLPAVVGVLAPTGNELDELDHAQDLRQPSLAGRVAGQSDPELEQEQDIELADGSVRFVDVAPLLEEVHHVHAEPKDLAAEIDEENWEDELPELNWEEELRKAHRPINNWNALWHHQRPGATHRREKPTEESGSEAKPECTKEEFVWKYGFYPGFILVISALLSGFAFFFAMGHKPALVHKPLGHQQIVHVQMKTSGDLQPLLSNAKSVNLPEPVHSKTRSLTRVAQNRNALSDEQLQSLQQMKVVSQINQLDS
jgi:hypothetical protein